MTAKLKPNDRRALILSAALTLAAEQGYQRVTREAVGAAAGIAPALISYLFGTMPDFRRDIMRAAVRGRNLAVVAQGLAAGDAHARKAPQDLIEEALSALK